MYLSMFVLTFTSADLKKKGTFLKEPGVNCIALFYTTKFLLCSFIGQFKQRKGFLHFPLVSFLSAHLEDH